VLRRNASGDSRPNTHCRKPKAGTKSSDPANKRCRFAVIPSLRQRAPNQNPSDALLNKLPQKSTQRRLLEFPLAPQFARCGRTPRLMCEASLSRHMGRIQLPLVTPNSSISADSSTDIKKTSTRPRAIPMGPFQRRLPAAEEQVVLPPAATLQLLPLCLPHRLPVSRTCHLESKRTALVARSRRANLPPIGISGRRRCGTSAGENRWGTCQGVDIPRKVWPNSRSRARRTHGW